MFYIRILKLPIIDRVVSSSKTTIIKSVITITTDLGETFYTQSLDLTVTIWIYSSGQWVETSDTLQATWKPYARALPVQISFPTKLKSEEIRIGYEVSSERLLRLSDTSPTTIPKIQPVFSSLINEGGERLTVRPFTIPAGDDGLSTIYIWEHAGESIARHVWDGGVGMLYLMTVESESKTLDTVPSIRSLLRPRTPTHLNAIELGAGCGIFSLIATQLNPKLSVTLTDLDDAREIAERNIAAFRAQPMNKDSASQLKFEELTWGESLPDGIADQSFDIVLISDCTYNPDSSPALVETISAVAEKSPVLSVIVSLKQRHETEVIFFDLMKDAGFHQHEHCQLEVPHEYDTEVIHVYLFRRKRRNAESNNETVRKRVKF